MARPAEYIEEDYGLVLRHYLRALARDQRSPAPVQSPGHDVRTCAACGRHTSFVLEPDGTWFRCSACGEYA